MTHAGSFHGETLDPLREMRAPAPARAKLS